MDTPTTVAAALALGAAGSVHCFVMCGPLACAARMSRDGSRRVASAVAYHVARVVAYGIMGMVLGALGGEARLPLSWMVPWLLAGVLVLAAVDPGGGRLKRLRPLPGIAQTLRGAARLRARLSPLGQALLMGGITPLLPCGLLYGVAAGAIVAGSARGGGVLMGAFGLGAVPALVAAQAAEAWVRGRRMPRAVMIAVQRGVPLVAAAIVVYRAVMVASSPHHSCH